MIGALVTWCRRKLHEYSIVPGWISEHAVPKVITLSLVLPFLSYANDNIVACVGFGSCVCLIIHHYDPMKKQVYIPVQDISLILLNLNLTLIYIRYFVSLVENNIRSYFLLSDLLYIPLWVISDEILFTINHYILHTRFLYKYIHRIHHKYKITSAWTTFYSHPVDNLFIVVYYLIMPYIMLRNGYVCSASVIGCFIFIGSVTFIGSHHSIGEGNGTEHLIHHQKPRTNYSNFGPIDKLLGTYEKRKDMKNISMC